MSALVWGGLYRYLLVQAETAPELVATVDEHQASGWQPIGGVAAVGNTWVQAMAKTPGPDDECASCHHPRRYHMGGGLCFVFQCECEGFTERRAGA